MYVFYGLYGVCVAVALPLLLCVVLVVVVDIDWPMQLCRDVVQNFQQEIKKTFGYFSKYFPHKKKLLTRLSFPA